MAYKNECCNNITLLTVLGLNKGEFRELAVSESVDFCHLLNGSLFDIYGRLILISSSPLKSLKNLKQYLLRIDWVFDFQ